MAARAEAIINRLDPGRVVYHHSFGQFRLDSHQQFLPELGPHPGDVRLVRALVDQGREAGLHVRVRRAVYLGLGDVPRLVSFRPAEGQAGIGERERAVGVLPGRVELAVPRGQGFPDQRDGKGRTCGGRPSSSRPTSFGTAGTTRTSWGRGTSPSASRSLPCTSRITGGPSGPGDCRRTRRGSTASSISRARA